MYGPAPVRPRAVENERDQERAKLGRLPGSAYNDEAAAHGEPAGQLCGAARAAVQPRSGGEPALSRRLPTSVREFTRGSCHARRRAIDAEFNMGATLTRAILADGYDSPSAGAEKVSSCAGSPQCAHGSPTSAITADALGEAPARVLRSHMLMPSMSRLPATLPSSEPANAPTRTVPPLRLGALAGALSAALPPGIGPACAVFCTPTQDRILAELGLPADPAWPPSSASDYLAGED